MLNGRRNLMTTRHHSVVQPKNHANQKLNAIKRTLKVSKMATKPSLNEQGDEKKLEKQDCLKNDRK